MSALRAGAFALIGILAATTAAAQQTPCSVPAYDSMVAAKKLVYACGAINATGAWGNGDTQELNPVLGASVLSKEAETRLQFSGTVTHDIVWARNNTTGVRQRKKNANDYNFTLRLFNAKHGIPLVPVLKQCSIVLCVLEFRYRSTFNEFKAHEVTSLGMGGLWFYYPGAPGSKRRLGFGVQTGLRWEGTDTTDSGNQWIYQLSLDARGVVRDKVTGGIAASYAPSFDHPSNYRTSLSADLSIPLLSNWLTLVPYFELRHDNQPPPGTRTKNDYQAKLFFQIARPFAP